MGYLTTRGRWIVLFIFGAGLVATVAPIVAFRLVSGVKDGGKAVAGGTMLLWLWLAIFIVALIVAWSWRATRTSMRAPTDTDAPF
jgi:heme/copper-type cytochrome/quinol oxidase subunit 2